MGLAERRAIVKLQTETLPKAQAELDAIAGTHVELAVDWDSYAEQDVTVIERQLPAYGLDEVLKTFSSLCRDQLGKDAVRVGVEKVQLRCPAKGADIALLFENKVLTVLVGEESYGYWLAEKITPFMESKL